MNTSDILRIRLRSQLIEDGTATTPREAVSRLLGVQAQDYAGASWAIGLRLPASTMADIERAITDRQIVRTWPMRGTMHFVAAEDVRWMLPLLTPRVLARAAGRESQLELDARTFARARSLFAEALRGGRRITRPDAMALLEGAGIPVTGQRGYHILWRLAQEGLIVLGPMEGRQQTFALLDDWVPASCSALPVDAPREVLLAHVASRYFAGHGPATLSDLARWAGLTVTEARAALQAVAETLDSAEHEGDRLWFAPQSAVEPRAGSAQRAGSRKPRVHLLPGFDEYMVGYTGRRSQMGKYLEAYGSRVASNGVLAPTVVVDGRVVAVWKRALTARKVTFTLQTFRDLTAVEREAVAVEQARYAAFVGREPFRRHGTALAGVAPPGPPIWG